MDLFSVFNTHRYTQIERFILNMFMGNGCIIIINTIVCVSIFYIRMVLPILRAFGAAIIFFLGPYMPLITLAGIVFMYICMCSICAECAHCMNWSYALAARRHTCSFIYALLCSEWYESNNIHTFKTWFPWVHVLLTLTPCTKYTKQQCFCFVFSFLVIYLYHWVH